MRTPAPAVGASRATLLLLGCCLPALACDRSRPEAVESASVSAPEAPSPVPTADFPAVAAKVVGQSAAVREGEIVLIAGRDEDLPLLEEIAIEVLKVGGHPLVTVSTERFRRREYDEIPAKYDGRSPDLALKLAGIEDVFINLESGEGRTMKGVPPERIAARAKAFAPVMELARRRKVRTVALGNGLYPSEERAELFGMSREELARLMYGGIDVDYGQLQATGERVRKALAAGKKLRVTGPDGTDLQLGIAGRQVVVSDGVISAEDRKRGGAALSVWLPAGEVFLTPVPGTAEGVIVADHLFFQGDRVDGLKLVVKAGKVVEMTARSGLEAVRAYYDVAGAGKDVVGVLDIGLNPAIELPEGGAVNVWSRAGAVTVGVGGNTWAGGDNDVGFGFAPEVPRATVEVDGRPIVRDGRLVAEGVAAR